MYRHITNVRNAEWFADLSSKAAEKNYPAGTSIHFQGEPSDFIGCILSGTAKAAYYSVDGEETWLGRFDEGEFFGHASFLTEMPTDFEITAETDVTVLIASVSQINDLFDANTDFGRFISKDLAHRLNVMIKRLVEAITLSAKGRICAELVRISNPIGIDPDRHVIRPNPVFVELALRVNSTRETVSRTVSELQKKGVVSRVPGALIVESPERLKAAINQ